MQLSSNLFERYRQELRLRNYRSSTIKAYSTCLRRFVRWLDPALPRDATSEQVRAYLLLCRNSGRSRSFLDQTVSALKFLYVELYGWPRHEFKVPRPRREQKLPYVPTRNEVLRIADATSNRRHRLAVLLLYAGGLRVSELVRARVRDVDLDRMVMSVRDAKGRKDRLTVLSEDLRPEIAWIIGKRGPGDYLVPGAHGGRWSTRGVQKMVRRSCQKAGVEGHVTPHSLRHAFATHLLERGVAIRHIQGLLGHARITTTARYTHMRDPHLLRIDSPL